MRLYPNIAIVGATGLVGSTMLQVLNQRLPKATIQLYASKKSAGKTVQINGQKHIVKELTKDNLPIGCDIILMSAGSDVSSQFVPLFRQVGVTTIDNSSCWRKDDKVPLIVPEVNATALKVHDNIVANPNCSTIQCVVALNQIQKIFGLKRIIYNTYQAVSGAGQQALIQLNQKKRYHDDIIPQIDKFAEDDYTLEEHKMIFETNKIFDSKILITATAVRVPVQFGHSVSINFQLAQKANLSDVQHALASDKNLIFMQGSDYPTAALARGKDNVFVGRLRQDKSEDNCFEMWVVADNIRKGAATNAVQIAQLLLKDQN